MYPPTNLHLTKRTIIVVFCELGTLLGHHDAASGAILNMVGTAGFSLQKKYTINDRKVLTCSSMLKAHCDCFWLTFCFWSSNSHSSLVRTGPGNVKVSSSLCGAGSHFESMTNFLGLSELGQFVLCRRENPSKVQDEIFETHSQKTITRRTRDQNVQK